MFCGQLLFTARPQAMLGPPPWPEATVTTQSKHSPISTDVLLGATEATVTQEAALVVSWVLVLLTRLATVKTNIVLITKTRIGENPLWLRMKFIK